MLRARIDYGTCAQQRLRNYLGFSKFSGPLPKVLFIASYKGPSAEKRTLKPQHKFGNRISGQTARAQATPLSRGPWAAFRAEGLGFRVAEGRE